MLKIPILFCLNNCIIIIVYVEGSRNSRKILVCFIVSSIQDGKMESFPVVSVFKIFKIFLYYLRLKILCSDSG